MTNPSPVTIRPYRESDLATLLPMNNAAVPAVSELTDTKFAALIADALVCLVADLDGHPAGFLLCLAEGQNYDSPNYAWVSRNRQRFAYTDRICVGENARGKGIGEALYRALFALQKDSGRTVLCEVNERPPNPGSMKFHSRLGFREIGRLDHGDKAVVFLEKSND
ncbi:GNAT family N-acetyltransferase [Roseibium sp.]|uniref:GNAT family N-acetyltransferase n=1 Tax=Roseibium sp. TaxID=1936156 RepID=UPI003A968CDA